jgi:hypothetical protein
MTETWLKENTGSLRNQFLNSIKKLLDYHYKDHINFRINNIYSYEELIIVQGWNRATILLVDDENKLLIRMKILFLLSNKIPIVIHISDDTRNPFVDNSDRIDFEISVSDAISEKALERIKITLNTLGVKMLDHSQYYELERKYQGIETY